VHVPDVAIKQKVYDSYGWESEVDISNATASASTEKNKANGGQQSSIKQFTGQHISLICTLIPLIFT